jgi:hypothetical protein
MKSSASIPQIVSAALEFDTDRSRVQLRRQTFRSPSRVQDDELNET